MCRTAIRRHNDERALQRRMTVRYWWDLDNKRLHGMLRKTGTYCSRWCCRRVRRYYGPSMQERRQLAWIEKFG